MAEYRRGCADGGPCRCARMLAIEAAAKQQDDEPDPHQSLVEDTVKRVSVEPSMAYYEGKPDWLLPSVCWHEAGHAVLCVGFGLKLRSVRALWPAVTMVESLDLTSDVIPQVLRLVAYYAAGRLVDEQRGIRDLSRSGPDIKIGNLWVAKSFPRCLGDTVQRDTERVAREAVRDAAGAIERVAKALLAPPHELDHGAVQKLLREDVGLLHYHADELDAIAAALKAAEVVPASTT